MYDPANDTWETRVLPAYVAQSTEPEILFTIDHYIYFIANYSNPTEFWRYDADNDSWKELTDMAYGFFPGGIGFAYEGMGYYGLGLSGNDNYWLYKYNPMLEP